MKESFLIHLLIASCGVVCCDAESSETQNPARLDDKSSHNSKHMVGGDKEGVLGDSSFREVYDKFDKELLNETGPFASEIWSVLSQSVNFVGTDSPTEIFYDDDSTTFTSESPVEETPTTTDLPDTPQTTIDDTSTTTDESTSTTDDGTTPDETTTMNPDKGE